MKKIDPIQKHIDDNAYIKKRNIEADLKISDIVRIAATNMGSMTKIVQNGSKTPIGFMFENLGKNGGYKPHEILNNNRGVVDDSVYSMTYSVGKFVEGKKESHMLSISIKKSGKAESVVTNVNLIYGKDKSADIQTLKEIGGEVGSAKEILVDFDEKEFFDELKSFFFEKADIQAIEQLMSQGGDEVALQELFNKAQYNAGIHPEFRDLRSKLNIVNVKRKQEEEAKKKREVSEQDKLNQAKRHAEKASRKSATLDRINRLPSRVDHLPNNIHNKPVTNKYKEEYFGSDEAELDDE